MIGDRQDVGRHPPHFGSGHRHGLDRQRAAAARILRQHCVTRIDREIDDDLLELAGIGADLAKIAAMLDGERHRLAKQPLEQCRYLGNHVGQRWRGSLPGTKRVCWREKRAIAGSGSAARFELARICWMSS